MTPRRVSAFPVVDSAAIVVGVVSATDLMPKEALEATVTVKEGAVTLAGTPENPGQYRHC